MQRLYEITFFVGVALVAGFAGTCALSLLSLIQVATSPILRALAGALAILVPINILLWHFNRRRGLSALEFPIPPRLFDIGFGALMGLVVLWLIYGFIAGRAMRPDAISHQRWEASFFAVWSATILLGVIALPFYNSKERRHTFRRRV